MTEEDKERIRAEEIFREEVRRDITSRERRSRWQALIGFLNTSFGLWILTTLLVGGALYLYGRWETHNRLDREISHRLRQAKLWVIGSEWDQQVAKEHPDKRKFDQQWFIFRQVVNHLNGTRQDENANSYVHISFYPEFDGRTFDSLVEELRKYWGENATDFVTVINQYENLEQLSAGSAVEEKMVWPQAEDAINKSYSVLDAMWLVRWGTPIPRPK